MNGKQLRNSILQWAIQGKLVPQDPNDEPASVLLERIRAEKKRLVKEGKIKKDKNESIIYKGDDNSYYEKFPDGKVVCIDEEIPFEIPQGWEWVRINSIAISQLGKTLDRGKESGKSYPYLCSINVYWEGIDLSKVKTFLLEDNELDRYRIQKGDLLICEGGDYARCSVWDNEGEYYYQNALHRVRFFCEMSSYFYKYVVECYRMSGIISGQGQTIQHFTYESMKKLCFPVPPISEQNRIITFLNTINPLIVHYGKSQNALDKLNAGIRSRLIASVLQEAIQGKLVPQDSSDEPALALLEKIAAEKQRLVKEGKLKSKDVITSKIYKGDDNRYYEQIGDKTIDISDEIPFEIPDNWQWARTKTLYKTTSGGTPEKGHPEYYNGSIPWVKVGDLDVMYLSRAEEGITELGLINSSAKIFPIDTILIAMYCNDAIGKTSILCSPMCTNQAICGLYPNKLLNKEYVFYVIQASKWRLQEQAAGGAQKNINQKIVNDLLIPIPPYQEQKRIANRIGELLALLN